MDIHASSIRDYVIPKVRSVFIIDYYEGIRAMLSSRADFHYAKMLANPRQRTQKEIIWSTDCFTEQPVQLGQLLNERRMYYQMLLARQLDEIQCLISTLKEEEGGKPLADLLAKVVQYVDIDDVYCGDDCVVLVNWGMIPRQHLSGIGAIYRDGIFLGQWPIVDDAYNEVPIQHFQHGQDAEDISSDYSIKNTNSRAVSSISQDEIISLDEIKSAEDTSSDVERNSGESCLLQNSYPPLTGKTIENSDQGVDKISSVPQVGQETVPHSISQTASQSSETINTNGVSHNTNGVSNLSADVPTFGSGSPTKDNNHSLRTRNKWLWIISFLILLLGSLLLLFLIVKRCDNADDQKSWLPAEPVVLPIEDNMVESGTDGSSLVASDRLNVYLEKSGKEALEEWARAFKAIYKEDKYRIVYYNVQLKNIQIVVPVGERKKIMNELKGQLPGFHFDIREEPVYECDDILNNSELSFPTNTWHLNAIDAPEAWTVTMGDSNVIVAVIDNGFDLTHPELAGKVVAPQNIITHSDSVFPIVTRYGINPHGTHVAALAVGNAGNGERPLGVAPGCLLMPIQVGSNNAYGFMSGTAITEGLLYAIYHHASVVNISIGKSAPYFVKNMNDEEQLNYISNHDLLEEKQWESLINMANDNGCTVVLSAGNSDVISGIDPNKRSHYAILVSAVNTEMRKAGFSNYGVFEDSNRIYSTVSAPGTEIYSAAPNNSYITMQGTSMAAPIVAGAVALMKSIDLELNVDEIIDIMKSTGRVTQDNIGPIINVGQAVAQLKKRKTTLPNCDDIQKQINILQLQIDSLRRLCPDESSNRLSLVK